MILFKRSFCLVFLLVMALALPALAKGPHTVAAEGVAVIRGNARDIARDAALEDAQKRAVEQLISILIDSQTQVENYQLINEKILPRTRAYITRYSITGENTDSGLLRVRIKAEVSTDLLTRDLAAINIHLSRTQKLRSVNITVIGLNKKQFVKFKNVLRNQVRGIKYLHERSFNGTMAKISVDSKNNAQILSDELLLRDFGSFSVEVVSSTANSLELKVTKK